MDNSRTRSTSSTRITIRNSSYSEAVRDGARGGACGNDQPTSSTRSRQPPPKPAPPTTMVDPEIDTHVTKCDDICTILDGYTMNADNIRARLDHLEWQEKDFLDSLNEKLARIERSDRRR